MRLGRTWKAVPILYATARPEEGAGGLFNSREEAESYARGILAMEQRYVSCEIQEWRPILRRYRYITTVHRAKAVRPLKKRGGELPAGTEPDHTAQLSTRYAKLYALPERDGHWIWSREYRNWDMVNLLGFYDYVAADDALAAAEQDLGEEGIRAVA